MIKVLGIEHIGVALDSNNELADIFQNIFNMDFNIILRKEHIKYDFTHLLWNSF